MRVLVSGAAGFIGSHIADGLVERRHQVFAVDDESGGTFDNLEYPQVQRIMEDCANRDRMISVCETFRPDTLVHCAANAREGASQFQPYSVTRRNLLAYVSTLSAALSVGCLKRVICFSSMAVYGDQEPPFDEDMVLKPVDVYAANKAAMENVTEILAGVHGFGYVIVRPHNVFGPRQAMNDIHRNVVGIFMNRIMKQEPIFIYGDGLQRRAFSYIGDFLPAVLRVIEDADAHHGNVYNIGGIQDVDVLALAAAVCDAMGVSNHPVEHLPDRPCEVKHAFCTFDKSARMLGYSERVGWREGVSRMAEWAKKKGPQRWRNTDALEIVNDKVPRPWLDIAAP